MAIEGILNDNENNIGKWDVYNIVRNYLETEYGAYSFDRQAAQRLFSIGFGGKYLNHIHVKMVEEFGFIDWQNDEGLLYEHESGLKAVMYLDKEQAPARYYFCFQSLY